MHDVVVIAAANPLRPFERAEARTVQPGFTLAELAPVTSAPLMCRLNDGWVLRKHWGYRVQARDVVEWHEVPMGGGDGSRTALTLALIVAVSVFQPQIGALVGAQFGAAASAGIIFAGQFLINALVPVQAGGVGATQAASSPTYDVALSGNAARLEQPIPVIYGRHLVYPNFAAQPYTEYDGSNDAYYHALLCIGHGEYAIERLMIDDTPLDGFDDVSYAVLAPGVAPTLVSAKIVSAPEVAGQTLLSGRYVGGFAASGPKLPVDQISIDIVCPRGLGLYDSSGVVGTKNLTWRVEYREVSDFGVALAAWATLVSESLTLATTAPVRRTNVYTISPARRLEIRLVRTDVFDANQQALHDLVWAGMRARLSVAAPLNANATHLELKIRASEQLSGLSQRRIGAIVRRKLKTWAPGVGWSADNVETRSIAWALADKWKSTIYGDGLTDNRIDLATLYELDQLWTTRQDRLDIVFDSRTDSLSADQTMAACGRARVFRRNGVRTLTRDGLQTAPVTAFTARDILPGSLAIDYALASVDSPDGVIVEYFDGLAWDWLDVECPAPGYTTGTWTNPVRLRLPGITGAVQAEREGLYRAADATYRRKFVAWGTEMLGVIPAYGSAVLVAPAMPGWGQSADAAFYDSDLQVLTLTEPLQWTEGAEHYISVLQADGGVSNPIAVKQGPTVRDVVLTEQDDYRGIEFEVDTALRERTRVLFGTAAERMLVRVLAIEPRGRDADGAPLISLRAVADDERVHAVDNHLLPGPADDQDPVIPEDGEGGGGGDLLIVNLPSTSDGSSQSIGNLAKTYFRLRNNGTAVTYSDNTGGDGLTTWANCWMLYGAVESSVAALYEVRATQTGLIDAGAAVLTGTLGTWQSLGTTRTWQLEAVIANWNELNRWTLRVEIREVSTGFVHQTATVTLGVGGTPEPTGGG